MTVNIQIHTFEVTFQQTSLEISHRPGGVGLDSCLRVLHHHHSVFVVGIDNRKSCFGQLIEEGFLRVAVVLEGLVIIQVVTGKVCENTARKRQSANTLLVDCMTGALHERIVTAGIHHPCQKLVQFDGIGCCMVCRYSFSVDIVAYR